MFEIIREPHQSSWVILLFFICLLIYAFLYFNDSKKLVYYFKSFYTKQYQVNYGRQVASADHFTLLLSLQSILLASFLLYTYLSFCTKFVNVEYLFFYSLLLITSYLGLKWLFIYALAYLFEKKKLFNMFLNLSTLFANLSQTVILISSIYLYFNIGFTSEIISILLLISLVLLVLGKFKVFNQIRKEVSLDGYYFILYLCAFEIVPFMWFLIVVDC